MSLPVQWDPIGSLKSAFGRNIDTMEIGQHYKSGLIFFPIEGIYQHTIAPGSQSHFSQRQYLSTRKEYKTSSLFILSLKQFFHFNF